MTAAITRAIDFLNSSESDGSDILIMRAIGNMDDLKGIIEGDILKYSETYGQTTEFGFWSHSDIDGPFRENGKGGYDQLSVENWSKIDFNWANDANAMFYGCRSGFDNGEWSEAGNKESFTQQLSNFSNMKNVNLWGQTQRSWPSSYTDARVYTDNIGNGNHIVPTYMVGSKIGITSFNTVYLRQPTYAYPMSVYRNGKFINYTNQLGSKR